MFVVMMFYEICVVVYVLFTHSVQPFDRRSLVEIMIIRRSCRVIRYNVGLLKPVASNGAASLFISPPSKISCC